MHTTPEIECRFRELVSRLEVSDYLRAFHTTPQHDGSPHIERVGEEFHFVVTERGSELERKRTSDPEEILYWLLEGVTMQVATRFETKNRIAGRDSREIWFPYQEELLRSLKPEWGERKKKAHARILEAHPFRS